MQIIQTISCLAFLVNYIFNADLKVQANSNRNRNYIFHYLGNPKGRTLDHFFYASHVRHNFPHKLDTFIDELVELFLKLSVKTVQMHLIIGTTLEWCFTVLIDVCWDYF